MVWGAGRRVLLEQVVLGGCRGGFQEMMLRCRGGLLLEEVLLRGGVRAELERGGIVVRLRRFRRRGRLGDGEPHRGGQAEHDRRKREEDGEMAPLHERGTE